MTPITESADIAADLLSWAKGAEIAKVEEAWVADVSALPNAPAFYSEWARAMRHAGAHGRVEELTAVVAEERLENGKADAAYAILTPILDLYPESETLRPLVVRVLKAQHGESPALKTVIKGAGLESSKVQIPDGLKVFQEYVKLFPGQVYQHYSWGEGVVKDVDLAGKKITIDFPNQPAKPFTLEGVRKFLKHIPAGSYIARRTKDIEALRELAQESPAELIKSALIGQADATLKQADLKSLIIGTVVDESGWNSWWGKAREALKLDPMIDFDTKGGARAVIKLRDKPRTLEQEIDESFFDVDADTAARAELIRRFLKWPKETPAPHKLAERMAKRLEEDWRIVGEGQPALRLELSYMLDDLAGLVPGANIPRHDDRALLAAIKSYDELMAIDHVDYAIRALERLLERDGAEGFDEAVRLLPRSPVKLAQAIWRALDEEHHHDLAVRALQELFNEPLRNVDTYSWAIRSTLDGSWGHMAEDYPAAALVPEIIDNMDAWQRAVTDNPRANEAAKSALSRMRTLLSSDKFAILGKAVEPMSKETITRLRGIIQTHLAFPDSYKAQADRAIRLTRRDLEEEPGTPGNQTAAAAGREDALHYCTARSQVEKMAELREIASVKIPTNSKIIEEARMEGDLKENAGYQYAKEEQKMLVQTQASLSDLLSRAHVIDARSVDTIKVGFGTRLRLQNKKSNEEETYTVLGRWEADPEHHVISMLAPMAQQLLNRRVGDNVTIAHPGGGSTDYQILEITNALASGEWDVKKAE